MHAWKRSHGLHTAAALAIAARCIRLVCSDAEVMFGRIQGSELFCPSRRDNELALLFYAHVNGAAQQSLAEESAKETPSHR